MKENWENIKKMLKEDEEVKELLKEEESYLPDNILAVQNIFMADLNDNQKEILLSPEDLLVKCLSNPTFCRPSPPPNTILLL